MSQAAFTLPPSCATHKFIPCHFRQPLPNKKMYSQQPITLKSYFFKKIRETPTKCLLKVKGPPLIPKSTWFFSAFGRGRSTFFKSGVFVIWLPNREIFEAGIFFLVIWLKNEFFVKWQDFFRQKAAPPSGNPSGTTTVHKQGDNSHGIDVGLGKGTVEYDPGRSFLKLRVGRGWKEKNSSA